MIMAEKMMIDDAALKMFDAPIPGQSITNNPDQPMPFERPPQFTGVDEAVQHVHDMLMEDEGLRDKLLTMLEDGIAVDTITQVLVFGGYAEGKWTPDLMMLLVEPMMYLILYFAEMTGIQPVLYDEEMYDGEPEEELAALQLAAKELKAGGSLEVAEELPEEITTDDRMSLIAPRGEG